MPCRRVVAPQGYELPHAWAARVQERPSGHHAILKVSSEGPFAPKLLAAVGALPNSVTSSMLLRDVSPQPLSVPRHVIAIRAAKRVALSLKAASAPWKQEVPVVVVHTANLWSNLKLLNQARPALPILCSDGPCALVDTRQLLQKSLGT